MTWQAGGWRAPGRERVGAMARNSANVVLIASLPIRHLFSPAHHHGAFPARREAAGEQ